VSYWMTHGLAASFSHPAGVCDAVFSAIAPNRYQSGAMTTLCATF